MKLRLFQGYYTLCLFKDNEAQNFIDVVSQFKNKFTNIKFILNEETVRNIKNDIKPGTRNYTLEEILNSIKIDIKDIQINNLQIKVYTIKNNKIIKREQKFSLLD